MQIIYSDDAIVVINKPAGVLSVPGRNPEHGESATERAEKIFGEIHVAHRLDCATSGVMVFGRTKDALRDLHKQFRDRYTEKEYIALTCGSIEHNTGEVCLPLICDWPNRPKQKVDMEIGKPSHTLYEVITREERQTRVRLTPVTGRSHQLRVHMMAIGHAIIGDPFYAPQEVAQASNRLCLHARTLGLYHPTTGQWITFCSEPEF